MSDDSLIQFPTNFLLKIVGEEHGQFKQEIVEIIQTICPSLTEEHVLTQISKNGRYTSLSVTVYVVSKSQLDSIYKAVGQHKQVKWML